MNNLNNKKTSKSSKTGDKKPQFIMIKYEHLPLGKIISMDELAFLGLIRNLSTTISCTATNGYLAKIMHVSNRTIGRYIKDLTDKDLLISEISTNTYRHRILKVNETKIKDLLMVGQDFPSIENCNDNDVYKDSQECLPNIDNDVYGDSQECLQGIDKSCAKNGENDCNLNNNPVLIDNLIDKKIDKEIDKGLQSNPTHPADALSSYSFAEEEYSSQHNVEEIFPPTFDNDIFNKICDWIQVIESDKDFLYRQLEKIDLLLRKIIIEEEIDINTVDYNLLNVMGYIASRHKISVRVGFDGLFLFNTLNKQLNKEKIKDYVESKETEYYKNFGYPIEDKTKLSKKRIKVLKDFTIGFIKENNVKERMNNLGLSNEKVEMIEYDSKMLANNYLEEWKLSDSLFDEMYHIVYEAYCLECKI